MPYLVSLPKMANWLRKTLAGKEINPDSAGFDDLMARYIAFDLKGTAQGIEAQLIQEVQELFEGKALALLFDGLDECGNMHDLLCEFFGSYLHGMWTGPLIVASRESNFQEEHFKNWALLRPA